MGTIVPTREVPPAELPPWMIVPPGETKEHFRDRLNHALVMWGIDLGVHGISLGTVAIFLPPGQAPDPEAEIQETGDFAWLQQMQRSKTNLLITVIVAEGPRPKEELVFVTE